MSKMWYKTSGLFYKLHRFALQKAEAGNKDLSVSERNKKEWYRIKGDSTLRVDYNLSPKDVVIDVGGYEGNWAAEIVARYGCRVFVFEPVPEFVSMLHKRFRNNPNVKILDYGLGDKNETVEFFSMEEASSLHRSASKHKGSEKISAQIRNAPEAFKELGITEIALMKINIEGGEYFLLPSLFSAGWFPRIRNIQVQFHDFIENSDKKLADIRSALGKTHRQTWCYDYVWENWSVL